MDEAIQLSQILVETSAFSKAFGEVAGQIHLVEVVWTTQRRLRGRVLRVVYAFPDERYLDFTMVPSMRFAARPAADRMRDVRSDMGRGAD